MTKSPPGDLHHPPPALPAVALTAGKRDLVMASPFANAAGFLGCDAAARESFDFAALGAYITPPLSLQPRTPARGRRVLAYPGGFLLHTGLPNPGLRTAIRRDRRHWSELPCPVAVHLILQSPDEAAEMMHWIEPVEEVAALELGLEEVDGTQAAALVAACAGELPLIAHLPLGTPVSVFAAAVEAGAQAVSVGAPRGALPGPDGTLLRGRLYGPAIFPLAAHALAALRQRVDVPIFASGGVYRREQAEALLSAGASAVQLDAVLWTTPEAVFPGDALRN